MPKGDDGKGLRRNKSRGSEDSKSDGQLHQGQIIKFDPNKGFGFIYCPALLIANGNDVFLHERQLNGFQIGDWVQFQTKTNAKGQLQASYLERCSSPADILADVFANATSSRDDGSVVEPGYRGTIKNKAANGHAYILCPEASDRWGQDVFVHSTELGSFAPGDPVRFAVKVSSRGQPQARELAADLPPHLTAPSLAASDAVAPAGAVNANYCRHEGVIKRIDDEKGFGFIDCKQLFVMFGCDVFVEKKQVVGFQAGESVGFTIKVKRTLNGGEQPQAVDLRRINTVAEAAAAAEFEHAPGSAIDRVRHEGMVKMVDKMGWGFIYNAEVFNKSGNDVYVEKKEIGEFVVGDRVIFTLKVNKRGQPQAVALDRAPVITATPEAAADPLGTDTAGVAEEEMTGTIKSFDADHGYGFISSAEVQEKFKRDVFLHQKQIRNFKPGDYVRFSVRINQHGNPQAHDLRGLPRTLAWLADAGGAEEAAPDACVEEEHTGVIKSFNNSKGYGFIDCAALYARYGRDVFIHQSQFEGHKVSDHVTFRVQVVRGQPQARDVALSAEGGVTSAADRRGASVARLLGLEAAAASSASSSASPRAVDANLNRALHRACASARVESVDSMQELLTRGADPNIADVTGHLPLMIAALNVRNSERKCRLLLAHRADAQARHGASLSVLRWARERISPAFAAFLEAVQKGTTTTSDLQPYENPPEEF